MEGLLRHELGAIARDRRSGAGELALRAVLALQSWLRRGAGRNRPELVEVAITLLRTQPGMAPLVRVANEVTLAAEGPDPGAALARAMRDLALQLRSSPRQIARHLAHALHGAPQQKFLTYSYSSTVVKSLLRSRSRIKYIYCLEGRPGMEGRTTARMLSRSGVRVRFATDAAASHCLQDADIVVLGADEVRENSFGNKIGTAALVQEGIRFDKKVWVLADTTKFLPCRAPRFRVPRQGPAVEVWRNPPRGVSVLNPYFERTILYPEIRLLTERGWMTPRQVRRELRKIRISSGLGAPAD